jgi:glycerate 2-kinase
MLMDGPNIPGEPALPLTDPGIHPGEQLHAAARDIFTNSLSQCSIGNAFDRHLHFEGSTLVHHPFPALQNVLKPVRIPLDQFRHIRIFALGKAAVPMLDALLTRLPRGLPYRALCAGPEKPAKRNWRIHSFSAGHPVPNEDSFEAARLALKMLRQSQTDTFVFFLISGGGSTLFELPLDDSITLADTIAFHEALVSCGATIHEINVVRKHFSAVKGGRLALAAPAATKLTLQIADVPLRELDDLASGPTIAECRQVLDHYHLLERFPASVRNFFTAAHLEETPGAKPPTGSRQPGARRGGFRATAALRAMLRPAAAATPQDPQFLKDPPGFGAFSLDTLLSSHDLVNAARDRAHQLGFKVVIDNTCDDWPYDAAALYLVRRFAELQRRHPRLCLISSGEVTVRLSGRSGTGGRNQQFALAAAMALAGETGFLSAEGAALCAETCGSGQEQHAPETSAAEVCIFSAGTDGMDGNSPVAGAIADATTLTRARALNFDPLESLVGFDACPLFSALGDTVVTGRTGHNLRDLRLLLSNPADRPTPLPATREHAGDELFADD